MQDERLSTIANCALYFPIEKVPLKEIFPKGRTDGGFLRAAKWFEFDSAEGPVRLNLRHDNLPQHLSGFQGYVAQLPNSAAAITQAQSLIKSTKSCLGVILPRPVSSRSSAFAALLEVLQRFDGFMFVADSILLADGTFLVGPMAAAEGAPGHPRTYPVDPEQCRHEGPTEGVDPQRVAMRERNYSRLAERGFRCVRWLPLMRTDDQEESLRPLREIAGRLLALNALFLWVAGSEELAASDELRSFVDANRLAGFLTEDERSILSTGRGEAHEAHANTIGWRLENMWSLAWILGFDIEPSFFDGQIPEEMIDKLIFEFLPEFDTTLDEFVSAVTPRSAPAVAELEDLFYCAHNAVRSAQLGEDTVPNDFHPVRDGGAVHERRHSLTWALSPGTDWDETDLST